MQNNVRNSVKCLHGNLGATHTLIYKEVSKNGLAFCIMSIVGSSDFPRPSTTMMANMMDEKLPSSFTLCSIIVENRDVMMVDTSIYKEKKMFLLITEDADSENHSSSTCRCQGLILEMML